MKRFLSGVIAGAVLVAAASVAWSDATNGKLGEDYAKASPAVKLALLAQAQTDRVLPYQDVSKAVEEVIVPELEKGKTSEEKLKIMGQLRTDSAAEVKKLNEPRKAAKKQSMSMLEPDTNLQRALALSYLSDTAGANPAVDQLECLKLVRDSTSWSSNGLVVHATLQDALERDEAFMKANHEGKLERIKAVAEKAMCSDFERTTLESPVLAAWIAAELKGGKAPRDVQAELKKLYDAKKVCFFSHSSYDGLLKRMMR